MLRADGKIQFLTVSCLISRQVFVTSINHTYAPSAIVILEEISKQEALDLQISGVNKRESVMHGVVYDRTLVLCRSCCHNDTNA